MAAVAVIVVVIAASALAYTVFHKSTACNGFKIVNMCPMTNRLVVQATGSCKSVLLKFYDMDGNLKTQATVEVGNRTIIPLDPNLAPGRYRVEVYSAGKVIDVFEANVSLAPYVIRSSAVAWPNGTIFINFDSRYPSCLESYGITGVIVKLNETSYNYTGFWPAGEIFTVNVGREINPHTKVDIILIDSFGDYYKAAVLQPR